MPITKAWQAKMRPKLKAVAIKLRKVGTSKTASKAQKKAAVVKARTSLRMLALERDAQSKKP